MDKKETAMKIIKLIDENNLANLKACKNACYQVIIASDLNELGISVDEGSIRIREGYEDFYVQLYALYGDICICTYTEGTNCHITNVTMDTPKETLLKISVPTGAYIFGNDYPQEFFASFYNELVSYGPKYRDDLNCSLYFELENAAEVLKKFESSSHKYFELNKKNRIERQKQELKKQLEALESEGT